jgi:hypothetical protein
VAEKWRLIGESFASFCSERKITEDTTMFIAKSVGAVLLAMTFLATVPSVSAADTSVGSRWAPPQNTPAAQLVQRRYRYYGSPYRYRRPYYRHYRPYRYYYPDYYQYDYYYPRYYNSPYYRYPRSGFYFGFGI